MFSASNGLEIIDTVLRWSKYTSYSECTGHIESILVLRVLAVLAVPTDEILSVLAVPAVYNPEILLSTGSIHSNEPRKTASPEVSAVHNFEILRVLAVSAAHKPEILRVHEVPAVFFSKVLYFTPRYWERLCTLVKRCLKYVSPNAVARRRYHTAIAQLSINHLIGRTHSWSICNNFMKALVRRMPLGNDLSTWYFVPAVILKAYSCIGGRLGVTVGSAPTPLSSAFFSGRGCFACSSSKLIFCYRNCTPSVVLAAVLYY